VPHAPSPVRRAPETARPSAAGWAPLGSGFGCRRARPTTMRAMPAAAQAPEPSGAHPAGASRCAGLACLPRGSRAERALGVLVVRRIGSRRRGSDHGARTVTGGRRIVARPGAAMGPRSDGVSARARRKSTPRRGRAARRGRLCRRPRPAQSRPPRPAAPEARGERPAPADERPRQRSKPAPAPRRPLRPRACEEPEKWIPSNDLQVASETLQRRSTDSDRLLTHARTDRGGRPVIGMPGGAGGAAERNQAPSLSPRRLRCITSAAGPFAPSLANSWSWAASSRPHKAASTFITCVKRSGGKSSPVQLRSP